MTFVLICFHKLITKVCYFKNGRPFELRDRFHQCRQNVLDRIVEVGRTCLIKGHVLIAVLFSRLPHFSC